MSIERKELQGWDAIGAYFGITARAAQEHERRHSLPVHRLPGLKGRVFAFPDELDRWKEGGWAEVHGGLQLGPASDTRTLGPRVTLAMMLTFGVAISVVAFAVTGLLRQEQVSVGVPSDWRVLGKTLTVMDGQGRDLWSHEFEHLLGDDTRRDPGRMRPQVLFSDFDGDGKVEVLFVYFPLDAFRRMLPDGGAELVCFRSNGSLFWRRKFGIPITTPAGRAYPGSLYNVTILARLQKPRSDGGLIIAGGPHDRSWVYTLAIYTAVGERVGEYVHPGWLFHVLVADLNDDGVEEIVLGGVNNGYGETGYGATLVVLDSRKVTGQGSAPSGDDRQAQGRVTGTEEAALLIREFARHPNPHNYCRVFALTYGGGVLGAFVNKGDPLLPNASFYFDRRLKLIRVQPELQYEVELLKRLPMPFSAQQRRSFINAELGNIKYLRNTFDPAGTSAQSLTGSTDSVRAEDADRPMFFR